MMRRTNTTLNALRSRARGERGSGELITAMIIIPVILALILSLIDMALYMQARSHVSSAARDGARMVAIYGGNNNPALQPPGFGGKTVQRVIRDRLWNGSRCTLSHCTSQPTVRCTPSVTTRAGEQVECSVTYRYRSLYGNSPLNIFKGVTGKAFTMQGTARAETGF